MLKLYIIGIVNLIVQPIQATYIIELIVHRSSTTLYNTIYQNRKIAKPNNLKFWE